MIRTILYRRNDYSIAIIDVYSGQAFLWAFVCGWLLKYIGKPYILSLHGGNLPAFSEKFPRVMTIFFDNAIQVICPSNYLQIRMSKFRQDIKVIANGIDIDQYSYSLNEHSPKKIIWLRAFHHIYNPTLAIKVLTQLVENGTHISLTMIGPDKKDGSLNDILEFAKDLVVRNQLIIISGIPKEQVPIELSKGDIFINTTNIDNTPVSVIEAMACGLCIVSTDVGGIPYLLDNEVNALLVPPNDPKAMASAISRILSDPGLAQFLSSNARKKAEEFDWDVVLPIWEQLFSEISHRDREIG